MRCYGKDQQVFASTQTARVSGGNATGCVLRVKNARVKNLIVLFMDSVLHSASQLVGNPSGKGD
jgi:hypothetical protein